MTALARSFLIKSNRFGVAAGEVVRDQAAQGRREGLSAERASNRNLIPFAQRARRDHLSVLCTRPTEDAEMRRVTGGRSVVRRLCALTAIGATFFMVAGPAAHANTPVESFSAIPSTTAAGGHPDLGVSFSLDNSLVQHSQSPCNCEDAKNTTVHLPAGFIGNPHATPQCTLADFSTDACPVDSQIGIAHIVVGEPGNGVASTPPSTTSFPRPIAPA